MYNLEIWVRGRSSSFKMAPFDTSHNMSSSSIVTMAILVTFLSRVSILTRDIDIANLSVRSVPVSDENGLTYRHSFFTIR